MVNKIDQVILKLKNRYEVQNQVTRVEKAYRIGIGAVIEVFFRETTPEIQQSIEQDAKPFLVWFYEETNKGD
jgi:hypothetical protein